MGLFHGTSDSLNRILVIRGGAIGDFILTLPTIRALRDAYPTARLEIVGYKHIAVLAENDLADAVRSIDYGPLSGFFAKNGDLDHELSEYFGSFDLILTYLFDPDQIFETNLRRAGAKTILRGRSKIEHGLHATDQLVAPLEKLRIEARDFTPRLSIPSAAQTFAQQFLNGLVGPLIALHVGSGSHHKNWPVENWSQLGNRLLKHCDGANRRCSVIIVTGEADQSQLVGLQRLWPESRNVRFATNLPLPLLAAVLSQCFFVGHDSGISHLAAAVGAPCLLLFGPTDPAVWAPRGDNVQLIRSATSRMEDIPVAAVCERLESYL